ncbi:MAG: TfoX/Sxy family protein [Rhodospirillales bacterium]|nr:TfoX/Sxy family protein [Rhodospirillales bacterium]MDH3912594.1 TfoX/Sxy family protein [Rhodospirillales bacterium]MDH3917297.1 TfoX/Sxy family protein [Rhodospirillales bacterium]MDH3970009.1 TfoX/Sxy family protein [Rhodospirillales bacterium]
MSRRDVFIDHVCDLLRVLGPVAPRRMFGGWGLYLDGVMFALIEGDRLYLKADQETEARFAAAECEPFTYEAKGKRISLSYREAPDGSLEDPDDLLPWARLALEAARRAKAAKR